MLLFLCAPIAFWHRLGLLGGLRLLITLSRFLLSLFLDLLDDFADLDKFVLCSEGDFGRIINHVFRIVLIHHVRVKGAQNPLRQVLVKPDLICLVSSEYQEEVVFSFDFWLLRLLHGFIFGGLRLL